jgi:hypothetical protein
MARKAFILTFDRDNAVDYKQFHEKLTTLPEIINWFHYIKSSYILISSEESATKLNEKIVQLLSKHPGKSWLLLEVELKNKNGRLVAKAWEWLNNQKAKIE